MLIGTLRALHPLISISHPSGAEFFALLVTRSLAHYIVISRTLASSSKCQHSSVLLYSAPLGLTFSAPDLRYIATDLPYCSELMHAATSHDVHPGKVLL